MNTTVFLTMFLSWLRADSCWKLLSLQELWRWFNRLQKMPPAHELHSCRVRAPQWPLLWIHRARPGKFTMLLLPTRTFPSMLPIHCIIVMVRWRSTSLVTGPLRWWQQHRRRAPRPYAHRGNQVAAPSPREAVGPGGGVPGSTHSSTSATIVSRFWFQFSSSNWYLDDCFLYLQIIHCWKLCLLVEMHSLGSAWVSCLEFLWQLLCIFFGLQQVWVMVIHAQQSVQKKYNIKTLVRL
jgi:hypothetical protein